MRKRVLPIVAAMAMMVSGAALGQGYFGAGAGVGNIDVDCTGLTTCDKSDTGFKLYGGYALSGPLTVEAVYFNWGKVKGSGLFDIGTGLVTGTGDLKADGFGVGVAYFIPAGPDWMPVLRAGVMRNKGKLTVSALGLSAGESHNKTTPYFGVGIGYKLQPNLFITGDADFSKVKYADSETANTRLLSIGVRFTF